MGGSAGEVLAEGTIPVMEAGKGLSRRSLLKAAAASGALSHGEVGASDPRRLNGSVQIDLALNGARVPVTVEPRTTLLSVLREQVDLTGAKEVCGRGQCGACTVLIDGRPVYSCLTLAVDCPGREVTTVEGLGSPAALSPVQAAFCRRDAAMCGYCTPGLVVSTTACLDKYRGASLDTIKRELAGNLCRCGTYPHVFAAALEVAFRQREEDR
jgi:xanthine dehydrogenase YagT iron-sulfur-binding subunit